MIGLGHTMRIGGLCVHSASEKKVSGHSRKIRNSRSRILTQVFVGICDPCRRAINVV